MPAYKVRLTLMITLADDEYSSMNNLMFNRSFEFSGERFSDIAPKIDALYDAVEKGLDHAEM